MSTQRSYNSGWDRIYQKSVQQPWIPIGIIVYDLFKAKIIIC
jgi:hypothetical protein